MSRNLSKGIFFCNNECSSGSSAVIFTELPCTIELHAKRGSFDGFMDNRLGFLNQSDFHIKECIHNRIAFHFLVRLGLVLRMFAFKAMVRSSKKTM